MDPCQQSTYGHQSRHPEIWIESHLVLHTGDSPFVSPVNGLWQFTAVRGWVEQLSACVVLIVARLQIAQVQLLELHITLQREMYSYTFYTLV